jgi:flavodoxin
MTGNPDERDVTGVKSLLVVCSYHHHNTEKVAEVFARVLHARVKTPGEVNPEDLRDYLLTGFGSGIYSGKHHTSLLDLVDSLPRVTDRRAFIFSTHGAPVGTDSGMMAKNHQQLREKLISRGYQIAGEFSCPGWNTNSFLKYLGGLNKGRPNAEDLRQAEEFAENLRPHTAVHEGNPKR